MTDYLDPLAIIGLYESGGDYNVLYGGGSLSGLPIDQHGFPQWGGKDNSHAAGKYQFEPATWALYASRLGITDFSPKSQDAVAAACYAVRGFADWMPFDMRLAAAVKAAGGPGAFSLGASWLAMTGTRPIPAPVPIPPSPLPIPMPEAPPIYIQIAAETADGVPARIVLGLPPKPSLGSVAKAVIVAMVIAGGAAICNSADGVAETKPTFWSANKPTFVLVPGPLGPLAAPIYE